MLPQAQVDLGWISLFDGETLFGWQPVGDAKWEVVDGEIRTDGSKPGWLMTTTRWANYEIDFEFLAPAATNSGVFLRTPLDPKDPARDCLEWNIAPPDNPFPTGSLVARQKANLPVGQSARTRCVAPRCADCFSRRHAGRDRWSANGSLSVE